MTPLPATTPSPHPEYCIPQAFSSMSPRRSSLPPTPPIGHSPAPFPAMRPPATETSAQADESYPNLSALSGAESSSLNVPIDSFACPNPDSMDESQLAEYLKSLSSVELADYLQRLSDEQLKNVIPAELLDFFDSQHGMGHIDYDTGTAPSAPTHSSAAPVLRPALSSMSTRLGLGTQSYTPRSGTLDSGEPWADVIIFPIRHTGRKGYDARVKQVRPDSKNISGLSVFVQYENPQVTPPSEWLDYHILRRRDNMCFIAHTGSHPHFKFKAGYRPSYILQDLKFAANRKRQAEVATEEERVHKRLRLEESLASSAADLPSASNMPNSSYADVHFAISQPQPATHAVTYWILNPAIRSGLGDRHLLLALKSRTDKKDQRTTFRTVDGQVKPWRAVSSGNAGLSEIAKEDIHENIKSYGMPSKPGRANGLYMICEGVHVGKTVRRLGESFELNSRASVAPLWVVQEVRVQGKGKKYVEEIQDCVLSVSGNALALIYEQEGDRAIGNAQMTTRRELYAKTHMNYQRA